MFGAPFEVQTSRGFDSEVVGRRWTLRREPCGRLSNRHIWLEVCVRHRVLRGERFEIRTTRDRSMRDAGSAVLGRLWISCREALEVRSNRRVLVRGGDWQARGDGWLVLRVAQLVRRMPERCVASASEWTPNGARSLSLSRLPCCFFQSVSAMHESRCSQSWYR